MGALFWPIALLMLGLGLIVAESILPSGGLLGILAGSCLIGSSYVAYAASTTIGLRWLVLEGMLVPVAWAGALYGLPRTRIGQRVYLQPPTAADLNDRTERGSGVSLVGVAGRALTPLRPSGMVELNGRRVEAIGESGLIETGVAVRVVAVRSGRLVVRAESV